MYKRPARSIQIDLVSTCNAKCLHCYRQTTVGKENIHYVKNIHIDPKAFKQALQDPYFDNLEEILFCGNYGDPIASPYLMEILDYLDELKPNLSLIFHTNGSLGSKELWTQLASRLNGRGRFIKFAIDGLENTNHIYRRGVSWSTLMENAKTFIEAGGRAAWMFVIFDHNKHQVEAARELSQKMGFAKFETRKNFASNYNPSYEVLSSEEQEAIISRLPVLSAADYVVTKVQIDSQTIECESKNEESVFFDHDGRIWPCCFIAGWKNSDEHSKRVYHLEKMEARFEPFFNSIYHHTPTEIMNHPLFKKEMQESWSDPDKIHYMCSYKCGKTKCEKNI